MLTLQFCTEKRPYLGEDAPPTFEIGAYDVCLMAVYDGLGGAGSTLYTLPDGGRTLSGAYLGARCAKATVETFFRHWEIENSDDFTEQLEQALKYNLAEYRKELYAPESRLKSKLIKTLPTTLAGMLIDTKAMGDVKWLDVTTIWAGDSRCFFWQADGLHQISVDDLHGSPDALQNLRLDATITNCLHAEGNFSLRAVAHTIDEPVVCIVATDGCFGYVQTPIHFEYILLQTLMQSHYDTDDWCEKLREALLSITGDDMSLVLYAWGFDNLEKLKSYFYARFEHLCEHYIKVWDNFHKQPVREETPIMREELENNLWERYKTGYYLYAGEAQDSK